LSCMKGLSDYLAYISIRSKQYATSMSLPPRSKSQLQFEGTSLCPD
jgi:hypothetical protein